MFNSFGNYILARLLWKQYFAKVDGVVFIVDAEDKERFPEARKELSVHLLFNALCAGTSF